MAVHTRLTKREISDILRVYRIGNLLNFSGIQEGIENTNYKIKTTNNYYILTIFEERVNKKNLPFFLNLMLNNKPLLLNLILFVSFVALISAFFIEYVLGHQPCNLCILERIPYLLAIVIILLNYKFSQFEKLFLVLLIIVFFTATIMSVYHFGIEQGFIEESLVCDLKDGSGATSKEAILKQLQEQKVSCKDVTFKIFGLSLTTYNIVISVLITINTLKIYLNDAKSN